MMNEKVKNILEWIECIVIAIILALLIRYFVGTPTVVQQSSMYPTLKQGERLILNRIPRTTKKMPNRGDIITFEEPSITSVSAENVDLSNPVATYNYNPTNIFKKFTYYVLEWNKRSYIKRVIALPGEHVQIKDGKVYINEQEFEEPYLQSGIVTDIMGVGYDDFVVPENCVFAMGDNRNHSTDCRAFGCIPLEKIESTVAMRIWPLDKWGKVE